MPSAAEIEGHRIDHMPYRSWCDQCVEGQGKEKSHGVVDKSKNVISCISFDYFGITKDGTFVRKDWGLQEEGTLQKVLLVRESKRNGQRPSYFAHAVPQKGVDENQYAVDCLVGDIEWLGYSKVVLKSDNERAIVRLAKESLKAIRIDGVIEQAGEEHSPEYDPQANGEIESAVGVVKGKTRTLMLGLEDRIRHRVPPEHPVVAWLVSHTTFLMNRRLRGGDGETAYQRIRGKPFRSELPEFGEIVRYKLRNKDSLANGTLAARWSKGVFIGMCSTTGQYIMFDDEVVYARSVMIIPDCQKWNMEAVSKVNVFPWEQHQNKSNLK